MAKKCTIESYSLAEKQLPSIPEPHDAVIRNISLHDYVSAIHPDAWTLEMKTLFDLAKKGRDLEYLYHRVYHKWIQLELRGITDYIVRMYADKVLMEWHER